MNAAFRSIRTRLLTWVLAFAGAILAAVIAWNYISDRQRLERDMEQRAFGLAESAAHRIDAQLGRLEGVVDGMALALESGEPMLPYARIRQMQNDCLLANKGIYGVCVAFDPAVAPDKLPALAGWAYRKDSAIGFEDLSGPGHAHTCEDWYSLPKQLGRPVWSEPYEWDGVLMVTYSVPIRSGADGSFAGVVTCDITIDWLDKMIATLPLGTHGYGLLMSSKGTYVSHPMPELVLNESVFSVAEERGDEDLRAIGKRMISGESAIIPFVSFATGKLSWLAFTPLESADWTMAALLSQEEMHAQIAQLARRQTAAGMAGLLLLWLAISLISRSITRPIAQLEDAAGNLADGDLDADLPAPRGRDEVATLTSAFGKMREQLKRHIADLQTSTAARERMQSELRIAHDIQMSLVPKTFPPLPMRDDIDLFAVLNPAREVGGDFYDFFLLDERRMAVAIGDVSGKGVPAALFMAVTRSFLRSAFRADSDPGEVMGHVNAELYEGNESCMFATLFVGVYDLADGSLRYVNAGHNPPIIYQRDAQIEWIAEPRGPAAGVIGDAQYQSGRIALPIGSSLILYTDGVTEAMNAGEELYGDERLAQFLRERATPRQNCHEVIDGLIGDVMDFADGARQSDDITVLALRQKPAYPKRRIVIRNNFDELHRAIADADEFMEKAGCDPDTAYKIRLALEELVTNVIKYSCDEADERQIEIAIGLSSPAVLTVVDDGIAFNPLEDAPSPVLSGPIEARPIGGLGLHMIKSLGMEIDYRRESDRNIVKVRIF
jgi:phosphoserine phosphatase RsbU/P